MMDLKERMHALVRKNEQIKWRKTIPWTDAQIAAELRAAADEILVLHPDCVPLLTLGNLEMARMCLGVKVRKALGVVRRLRGTADYVEREGHISSKILGLVLPRLIQRCTLCGQTALYRYGTEGRCRAHRLDIPVRVQQFMNRRAAKNQWLDRLNLTIDRERKSADRTKAFDRSRRKSR